MTKTAVDAAIRNSVFNSLNLSDFSKINDRQYGAIVTDANGDKRYVRVGVIVAALREDMTAEELMQSEIDEYNATQVRKAEKAEKAAAKAAADAERRAAREAAAEASALGE